jgi:ribosomal protein L39E
MDEQKQNKNKTTPHFCQLHAAETVQTETAQRHWPVSCAITNL